MDIVKSKDNVPIRLTDERWIHIVENHEDLAGYYEDVLGAVEEPDYIIEGYKKALIALKKIKKGKFLAVVYRETTRKDGFIITSYFAGKLKLEKEVLVWQKK